PGGCPGRPGWTAARPGGPGSGADRSAAAGPARPGPPRGGGPPWPGHTGPTPPGVAHARPHDRFPPRPRGRRGEAEANPGRDPPVNLVAPQVDRPAPPGTHRLSLAADPRAHEWRDAGQTGPGGRGPRHPDLRLRPRWRDDRDDPDGRSSGPA